jgi:DnaK suppressor protein
MKTERSTNDVCGLEKTSYMDETQLNYFKNKLINLKMRTMEKIYQIKTKIKTMRDVCADILDRSNSMVAIEHELHSQERYRQRLRQIDAALERIEEGGFGYCQITGTPIGLKRLEALPYTAVSMEALQDIDIWQ